MTQRIIGTLDITLLQEVIGAILRSKEIFSVRIVQERGLPVFERMQTSGALELAADVQLPQDTAISREEAAKIAALRKDELYRFVLVTEGSEHMLIAALHHLISDEQTMQILFREIWDTYTERIRGKQQDIEADAGFSMFCRSLSGKPEDVSAWQALYAAEPLHFSETLRGDAPYVTEQYVIPPERITALRQSGNTLFTALFTAVCRCIGTALETESFSIATAISAAGARFSESCGMFVHEHVLPVMVVQDEPFAQTVSRIAERLRFAYAHNSVCFDELMRKRVIPMPLAGLQDHIVLTILETERAERTADGGMRILAPQYAKSSRRADLDILIEHIDGYFICEVSHFCTSQAQAAAALLKKTLGE